MAHRKFKAPRPQIARLLFNTNTLPRQSKDETPIVAAHVWSDQNGEVRIKVVR